VGADVSGKKKESIRGKRGIGEKRRRLITKAKHNKNTPGVGKRSFGNLVSHPGEKDMGEVVRRFGRAKENTPQTKKGRF